MTHQKTLAAGIRKIGTLKSTQELLLLLVSLIFTDLCENGVSYDKNFFIDLNMS